MNCSVAIKNRSEHKPSWSTVASHSESTKYWVNLHLCDGVVCRLWETPTEDSITCQLILLKALWSEVLYQLHNIVTSEISNTLGRIQKHFYRTGCHQDIQHWCRNCELQDREKERLQWLSMMCSSHARDCSRHPGPTSCNRFREQPPTCASILLCKVDRSFPNAVSGGNESCTDHRKRGGESFGVFLSLHSDQGCNFELAVFSEICSLLGIQKTRTTLLHL